MTQPGETDSYAASDHVRTIQGYTGEMGLHICLLNSRSVPATLADQYASTGAEPVRCDEDEIHRLGVVPIVTDLIADGEQEVRHDPVKLARWIIALTRAYQRARELDAGEVPCVALPVSV